MLYMYICTCSIGSVVFPQGIMIKSCATLPFPDFTVSILGAWALELGLPVGGVAENPF